MMIRTLILCACAALVLGGCEGTQTGRSLFGTPSNNVIASMQLSFPTHPDRTAGTQFIALQVNAYDRWGNIITVQYNNIVTLTSTGSTCEIGFAAYQSSGTSASPAPAAAASFAFNAPQPVGVEFNPACGPNPVTVTASSPGVPSATISF